MKTTVIGLFNYSLSLSYLPTCLPAWVPTCLPACLSPCRSAFLPACLLASLPADLPHCLPTYLPSCLPTYLSVCMHACLPACQPTWLTAGLSACIPDGLPAWLLSACLPAYLPECLLPIHLPLPTHPKCWTPRAVAWFRWRIIAGVNKINVKRVYPYKNIMEHTGTFVRDISKCEHKLLTGCQLKCSIVVYRIKLDR